MPQSSGSDADFFENIRLIATDMDGTLTQQGQFTAELLKALEKLAMAGLSVVIVTGRSAGWVSSLAHYLPVVGAIAENGGVFYRRDASQDTVDPELLVPIDHWLEHRRQLAEMFQHLQQTFPQLQESADNRFRITDWTFDVAGLSVAELAQMRDRCQEQGWDLTYSTVQCHIKLPAQEKSAGLLKVLLQYFPSVTRSQVVTVGDSPNDESLFNPELFPYSVGVANVRHYLDQITHQPRYITVAPEVEGFCELARMLLKVDF